MKTFVLFMKTFLKIMLRRLFSKKVTKYRIKVVNEKDFFAHVSFDNGRTWGKISQPVNNQFNVYQEDNICNPMKSEKEALNRIFDFKIHLEKEKKKKVRYIEFN